MNSGGRGASGAAESPSTISLHLLVSPLPEWVGEAFDLSLCSANVCGFKKSTQRAGVHDQ